MRVLVARTGAGQDEFGRALKMAGATVRSHAVMKIGPPADPRPLDSAVSRLSWFDWLAVTSANAVRSLKDRLYVAGLTLGEARPKRIAAVGNATGHAVSLLGWAVDLIPERHDRLGLYQSLVEAMSREVQPSPPTLLLPQSHLADRDLARSLADAGYEVHAVAAYSSMVDTAEATAAAELLGRSGVDAALFTSPSAFRAVRSNMDPNCKWPFMVALGSRTGDVYRRASIDRLTVTSTPTPAAVVEALAIEWNRLRGGPHLGDELFDRFR